MARKKIYPFKTPFLDVKNYELDLNVLGLVPFEFVDYHKILPIDRVGNILTVGMADPDNEFALDCLETVTGLFVIPFKCDYYDINKIIHKYYLNWT